MMLYPLRFTPCYFEKVWGGRRLQTVLGREIPPDAPIGESWEVSDHPHGRSVVANGAWQGVTLHALVAEHPDDVLGTRVHAHYGATFPLLVKYIDAEDKLSVQVHPDDAYAAQHAGELGKTEMWYVLHAEPGATLIAGLCDGVTAVQFREALQHGDPAGLLQHLPVATGDSIFIPAGRIHAIMPGLLILEIQQNSDTTYRLYDWGRVGLDGAPRELHVEQAMAVTNWQDYTPTPHTDIITDEGGNRQTRLAACAYFVVDKYSLRAAQPFCTDGGSFTILNCVAGGGTLRWADGEEALHCGDTLLIPAALTSFSLIPHGEADFVLSSVP
ncbi:MAG TPA: type I phosphomannose isomerase catalytic subunit [Armatimonadota bacterium]|jgi:mannose-6-phosphate isomerase